MPVQTGSRFPYPEFKARYDIPPQQPVHWQWSQLAQGLGDVEHPERGTLALSLPDGSAEVLRDVAVGYQVVPAGEHTGPHAHSWYHLSVVQTGTGTVTFDESGETVELNPGDILLVPAWSLHRFTNPTSQDLVLLNLMNIPLLARLGNLEVVQQQESAP
ncbi:cupin domain-containing protein [Streptomyces natalensis]|uniref:cupin domain-containing protein n=1 Tax=Streptomyces natalensis TaxID=68242 RepID=UPI0005C84C8E|nr:cupin domain-containing protein [Streptomyces natalensis]